MALIGKIREKSGLLVGFVGVAMLAFILSDYKSLIGFGEGEYGIGLVQGEKVNIEVYGALSARVQEQDKAQMAQQQKPYGDVEIEASNEKAWNFMVDSMLLINEYNALDINVSDKEFNAYLMASDGFSPLQDLNQFFVDSLTGAVTEKSTVEGRKKLQSTINQLKSAKGPKEKQQWEGTKKYFTDRRKNEKYFSLVSQGLYVTKLEGEEEHHSKKTVKKISYVQRKYTEINDADIAVSEAEIQSYFDNHKGDKKYWNQSSNREIKVFDVAINPSKSDTAEFNQTMAKLRSAFMSSTNDSIFIMKESEMPQYLSGARGIAVPEQHPKANQYMTFPNGYEAIFKSTDIGQLVGPYRVGEKYYLSKLIRFSPSKLKARHILISTKNEKGEDIKDEKIIAQKKNIADSILKVTNQGNFAEMARKFSEDPGSKDKGGEYADFLEGDMVKEFGTYCVTAKIGEINMVKTDFGFHIMQTLERDSLNFPVLATIVKTFKASELTLESMETNVNQLLYNLDLKMSKVEDISKKLAIFDTIVSQSKYFSRPIYIEDNAPKITGLTTESAANELLKLAYDKEAKVGNLTIAPVKDKDKYIIGVLTAIREKGEPKFEDVRKAMEKEIMTEKKAKRLINQMGTTKDLQALAKQGNTVVESADITFSNPSIGNSGFEPDLVGSLFSKNFKDGSTTPPTQGKMGVYVIKVNQTIKAPSNGTYKEERDQLLMSLKGGVQGQITGGLRKRAEVVDNRRLYNIKVRM